LGPREEEEGMPLPRCLRGGVAANGTPESSTKGQEVLENPLVPGKGRCWIIGERKRYVKEKKKKNSLDNQGGPSRMIPIAGTIGG